MLNPRLVGDRRQKSPGESDTRHAHSAITNSLSRWCILRNPSRFSEGPSAIRNCYIVFDRSGTIQFPFDLFEFSYSPRARIIQRNRYRIHLTQFPYDSRSIGSQIPASLCALIRIGHYATVIAAFAPKLSSQHHSKSGNPDSCSIHLEHPDFRNMETNSCRKTFHQCHSPTPHGILHSALWSSVTRESTFRTTAAPFKISYFMSPYLHSNLAHDSTKE